MMVDQVRIYTKEQFLITKWWIKIIRIKLIILQVKNQNMYNP